MKNKVRGLATVAVLLSCVASALGHTAPKYVFYFIGDGMGMNQVGGTEAYLAAKEGRIGAKPLLFADFPYTAFATTFSASNWVTDSAAGGTALATGEKTFNGCLGLLPDSITSVSSVANWAKDAGVAVGIATSVSVDHATPASFYAHRLDRNQYYEIGLDLIASGFDFFAGSDFLHPEREGRESLYALAKREGYTIARGYDDYQRKARDAGKMVMLQTEEASRIYRNAIPYAIDRKEGDMTLQEITRAGIGFLQNHSPEGFFMMVEGGRIDWACHAQDAATVFEEVVDLDNAVRIAYEFYRQHPDETLIVVTADHETGGLGLGNGNYTLNLKYVGMQRMSAPEYTPHLRHLMQKHGDKISFDIVKRDLQECFGFWEHVPVDEYQEDQLYRAYEDIIAGRQKGRQSMYAKEGALASLAREILCRNARLAWTSGTHTNGYVPVFATGVGADAFHGRINNTDIPKLIGRIAGYRK